MADGVYGANIHRLFFSMSELSEIRQLEKSMNIVTQEKYPRDVYCQESQGLLSFLVKNIRNNTTLDSNMRYLFITGIESIIRGASSAERLVVVNEDILSVSRKTGNVAVQ